MFKKHLWQCMVGQALVIKSNIEGRRSSNQFGIIVWQYNESESKGLRLHLRLRLRLRLYLCLCGIGIDLANPHLRIYMYAS